MEESKQQIIKYITEKQNLINLYIHELEKFEVSAIINYDIDGGGCKLKAKYKEYTAFKNVNVSKCEYDSEEKQISFIPDKKKPKIGDDIKVRYRLDKKNYIKIELKCEDCVKSDFIKKSNLHCGQGLFCSFLLIEIPKNFYCAHFKPRKKESLNG
jgi:hypothetical protein